MTEPLANVLEWNPESAEPPRASQPQRMEPQKPWAAVKYTGAVAAGYDAKREQSAKWLAEDRIVRDMLDDMPVGTTVLDVPVGTGRFIPFYEERGFEVVGLDVQDDMLCEARKKVRSTGVMLAKGNVLDLPHVGGMTMRTGGVDVALMIRLSRWLEPDDCRKAMAGLAQVARKRIIFTARVRNHPYARPLELFAVPGWKVTRDEPADGEDYRVVMMEPDALA